MNVGKVLSETARRMPQKTAVIFKDEKIDFAALDLRATRLANKLQGSDVKKGDRVAIILPNSSQFVVAYFAEWGIYDRNYHVTDIPAEKLTHVIYAFAKITRRICF